MPLVAGRADHIQDQKLAVPIPVRVLQRFPLIVEKCNLLFQFNGQVLVNDLARMNPVMIVCKKYITNASETELYCCIKVVLFFHLTSAGKNFLPLCRLFDLTETRRLGKLFVKTVERITAGDHPVSGRIRAVPEVRQILQRFKVFPSSESAHISG